MSHIERDGISNHRRLNCLYNHLFRRRTYIETTSSAIISYNFQFHLKTHQNNRMPIQSPPIYREKSVLSHKKHATSGSWRRHQMETFSTSLAICVGNSPVTDEFPSQRPVTRSFYVFFDLRLNKRSSKQWWGWWIETLSRPLWRHCNGRAWLYSLTNNCHWNTVVTGRTGVVISWNIRVKS